MTAAPDPLAGGGRPTMVEKLLLGLAWVAPFGASMLAESPVRLQVACLALIGLLWLVWRRLPARDRAE